VERTNSSKVCPCPVPRRLRYRGLRDRLFGVPGEWSILECPECGLTTLSPRPLASELPAHYAGYYTHDEVGDEGWVRRILLRGIPRATCGYEGGAFFERRLGRMAARSSLLRGVGEHGVLQLPASERGELLDYGCGSGVFLERMQALGWRVAGFEPDRRALVRARQRVGDRPLFSGAASEISAPPGGFDVITLVHVIEHLPDPGDTLHGLGALLGPKGRLVVLTPNAHALGREEFGRDWLHWDPPRHLQVFTARALGELLERAGLATLRTATLASTSHFAYRASAQLAQTGALEAGRLAGPSPKRLVEAFSFWRKEARAVAQGRGCGEELLMVARRPDEEP